tara:strand:+ start:341 stop:694 length:354 start_codon:yes stop_codon:yes gene_type:complete
MRFSRKELVSMIEEEAERTTRLAEVELQNVKEPLTLEEIDMLDLLLTRADLYGTVPDGHSPDVFGAALDAANDLYNETKKQFDKEQPPSNAPQSDGQQGSDWNNQRWEKSGSNWDNE